MIVKKMDRTIGNYMYKCKRCQYIHVMFATYFVNAGLLFVGICDDIIDRRKGKGAAVLFCSEFA